MATVGWERVSASILGGGASGTLIAIATVRGWPEAQGLERLYAGVFIGTAAWLAAIFAALLASSGARAWRRMLLLSAAAAAAAVLHDGLLT